MNTKWAKNLIASIGTLFFCSTSFAALDLEVTQGLNGAQPIAVLPFSSDKSIDPTPIIRNDLQHSGRFQVWTNRKDDKSSTKNSINFKKWKLRKQNEVISGSIKKISSSNIEIDLKIWDIYSQKLILNQSYSGNSKNLRRIAHQLSDDIFYKLTGERGVFSTFIAYELVNHATKNNKANYKLIVSDFDGHHPRLLLESHQPIISPSWSPDGKKLAYVSFEAGRPAIFTQEIATGRRHKITQFPGINSAPSWSPDGKQLAFVLSKTGNPNIYIMDFETWQLKQLTDGRSIDTEPKWTPDGKNIIFTSNREGSPQLFELNLKSKKIKRITFDGRFNASATVAGKGDNIGFLHLDADTYSIAVKDRLSDQISILTSGRDAQSPSMAPNGQLIIYTAKQGSKNVLGIVSIDGAVKLRLPAQNGNVEEPAWSPYMSSKTKIHHI